MKSNIVLTSTAALLVSAAGANALEYRPFVGLTMGFQGSVYSDTAKDIEREASIDFPTDFFAFGMDFGVRAGSYFDIYNGGLTISATKTTYSNVQQKYVEERAASADMFNISMTYDNYIRISGDKESRIDVVIGAGAGAMATHFDVVGGESETKWSFAPELKIGMDFELTEHFTLSASFRTVFPTRPHYESDVSYIFGGAIKYLF